jgi:hypothetical protein
MKAERTIRSGKPNRRPVRVAAVVASCLMLGHGLAYRVLAARLAAPATAQPVAPESLARFPLQLGEWTGQEVALDEAIRRGTDTDALVNRQYTRRGGLDSVSFYIACGVKARDLMPHRPEVCYTGAGWTRMDRRSLELPLSNGMTLPCNVMWFSRGVLNTVKIVVLDYYIVDGEYCRDVSLLRSKAWRGSGTVRYVAQVQISTSITGALTSESAVGVISEFAAASASPVAGLFEHTEGNQKGSVSQESGKGE